MKRAVYMGHVTEADLRARKLVTFSRGRETRHYRSGACAGMVIHKVSNGPMWGTCQGCGLFQEAKLLFHSHVTNRLRIKCVNGDDCGEAA